MKQRIQTACLFALGLWLAPGFVQAQDFEPALPAADGNGDAFTLVRNGADVELRDATSAVIASQAFATITRITIEGTSDDDALFVDYSGGNPVPDGTRLVFNGRGGSNDLTLGDGTVTSTSYLPDNATDGTIDLDGGTTQILFTDLSFVADVLTATAMTVKATGAADNIVVMDAAVILGVQANAITNGGTFTTVLFGGKTNVTVDGFSGNDGLTLNLTTPAASLAALTLQGGNGNDALNVQANAAGPAYTLAGGIGNDQARFGNAGNSLDEIHAAVTVDGQDGDNDSIVLNDQGDADAATYAVGTSTLDRTGAAQISYANVEVVSVNGGTAADRFEVTPSAATEVFIDGGDPAAAPGDGLDLIMTGVVGEAHTVTVAGDAGTWSFSGRAEVHYDNVETQLDLADLVVSQTVDFDDPFPGDEVEVTLTVTNNGPQDATDVDVRTTLPNELVYDRSTVTTGTFAHNSGVIDWNDLSIASGNAVTLVYVVVATTELEGIYNIAVALLSKDQADEDYATNTLTFPIDIQEAIHFPPNVVVQAVDYWRDEAGNTHPIAGTHNFGVYRGIPDGFVTGTRWADDANDDLTLPLYITDVHVTANNDILLATWGRDGLYRSSDGARTWQAVAFATPGEQILYAIAEAADGQLFASANNGLVYRSEDGGASWTQVGSLPGVSADTPWTLACDPNDATKVYAGTFGRGVYVTTNRGQSWAASDDAGMGEVHVFDLEFDPALTTRLYAATAVGVFYTDDGGANWTAFNDGLTVPGTATPLDARALGFAPPANGPMYVATWGFGVYVIPDRSAATTWDGFALGATQAHDLALDPERGNLLVATQSDGALVTNSSGVVIAIEADATTPAAFVLAQNYPNPFNPVTTIQFELPATTHVRLAVYDVLGREVAVLAEGPRAAGANTVTFDAANLPSGTYLYRLETATQSWARTMVLVK